MKKIFSWALIACCALMIGACGSSSKEQKASEADYTADIEKYVELGMEHAKAMKNGEFDKAQRLEEQQMELTNKYDDMGREAYDKFYQQADEAFQKEYESVYGGMF